MHTELSALRERPRLDRSSITCVLSNRPLSTTEKVKVVVTSVFLAAEVGAMALGTYILTHGVSEHIHDDTITGGMIILGGLLFSTVTVAAGCLNFSRRHIAVQPNSSPSIYET